MERGPVIRVLRDMIDTDQELDIILRGDERSLEIRNVLAVDELRSEHGLHIQTRQNNIWIDASHVSAMWQVRADLDDITEPNFIPSAHNRLTSV